MQPDSWSCSVCSRVLSRKGDLTRHMITHTGLKPYKCEVCGKSFSQHSGLKTHRNTHTKARPFLCTDAECKASFGDPSSRARHIKETHDVMGTYHCPEPGCNSRIKRRSAFAHHVLKKHNREISAAEMDALEPPKIKRVTARRGRKRVREPCLEVEEVETPLSTGSSEPTYVDILNMSNLYQIDSADALLNDCLPTYNHGTSYPPQGLEPWYAAGSNIVPIVDPTFSYMSTPSTSRSMSSCPSPLSDFLLTPDQSTAYRSSAPVTPSPSSQPRAMYPPSSTYSGHCQPMANAWENINFASPFYGTPQRPELYEGISVTN